MALCQLRPEGHGGFAGAWLAFDKEKTAARKPPNRTSSSPATPEAAAFDGVLTLTPYSSWLARLRADARLCHKQTFGVGFSMKG
jgi:hypothetical protein